MAVYGVSRVEIAQVTIMEPREPIMLYVGIDQHRKQLTVSVREETGNVLLVRQVSTEGEIGAIHDCDCPEGKSGKSGATHDCDCLKSVNTGSRLLFQGKLDGAVARGVSPHSADAPADD